MRSYKAVIEHCPDTGFYVGYVPGWPERIRKAKRWRNCANLREVISMLLEDGEPTLKSDFIGVETVTGN